MKNPLVSIIVPTRNSEAVLDACLKSIKDQTYKDIELIVVDRNSNDSTKAIAKKYHAKVFNKEPERSAQRNYGANQSKGEYLFFIDSDMELTKQVVEECIAKVTATKSKAIIVPEESFGIGFWANCKRLERSFYIGNDDIEAARFIEKKVFFGAGAYNTEMISGEDWDLSRRVHNMTSIERVDALIMHNEGHINLTKTLGKKYYYAKKARVYFKNNPTSNKLTVGSGPLARYKLFLSHPIILFRNPVTGLGMLFMKTSEYAAGYFGYISRRHEAIE